MSIAEGVIRLLSERELARRIAQRGLEIVQAEANFAKEVRCVETAYYNLLGQPRRPYSQLTRARIFLRSYAILSSLKRHPEACASQCQPSETLVRATEVRPPNGKGILCKAMSLTLNCLS